jgi:hypothetical protein
MRPRAAGIGTRAANVPAKKNLNVRTGTRIEQERVPAATQEKGKKNGEGKIQV